MSRHSAPRIRFTKHAELKLSTLSHLGVTREKVIHALKEPDEMLYDTETDHLVAVKYENNLAVVFDYREDNIVVITVIYSAKLRRTVENRKTRGRWI
jgi:hypothetical protein